VVAGRERERLGLGDEEVGDLAHLLDHEGLKVYRPTFPPASPLEGLFLFDVEVGPVFVTRADRPQHAGDFVLARLYAHYLMDSDPYEIRLALGGEEPRNEGDFRAQAFAASFLVSRGGIERYLTALKRPPGDSIAPGEIEQLAAFFEVDRRTILLRLLLMGHLQPEDVPSLLRSLPPEPGPVDGEEARAPLSDRFVRLALEAEAKKLLTPRKLAMYLETDLASARRLADGFAPAGNEPAPS
jgi:Zn-dependent peptidase ImmA (M78 family)